MLVLPLLPQMVLLLLRFGTTLGGSLCRRTLVLHAQQLHHNIQQLHSALPLHLFLNVPATPINPICKNGVKPSPRLQERLSQSSLHGECYPAVDGEHFLPVDGVLLWVAAKEHHGQWRYRSNIPDVQLTGHHELLICKVRGGQGCLLFAHRGRMELHLDWCASLRVSHLDLGLFLLRLLGLPFLFLGILNHGCCSHGDLRKEGSAQQRCQQSWVNRFEPLAALGQSQAHAVRAVGGAPGAGHLLGAKPGLHEASL
mmetsp:Transcript_21394/g.37688  ORF Transcript_21394/g.37688 Transcript_21394/m.37688 type:complete len:255 (-) Transcript_21394:1568-2332(-)